MFTNKLGLLQKLSIRFLFSKKIKQTDIICSVLTDMATLGWRRKLWGGKENIQQMEEGRQESALKYMTLTECITRWLSGLFFSFQPKVPQCTEHFEVVMYSERFPHQAMEGYGLKQK